jgi:hypothetical protein
VVVGVALLPAGADGSRPPTNSENDTIRSAFREAHYNTDDGVKLKSVREIRLSTVDSRWASVLYKKGKRGGKKRAATATDYFFLKGSKWKPRKKGQVPRAVVQDLKQTPRPFTATIKSTGSGTFSNDRVESEPGYSRHGTGTFNWDLTWEGVELYDDHYPHFVQGASAVAGGGSWSVTAEDPPCSATGTFAVAPIMQEFYLGKGAEPATTNINFRYPAFVSPTGCGYLDDIWGDVAMVGGAKAYDPQLKGVPIFPERTIEGTVRSETSDLDGICRDGDFSFPGECTLQWSANVTITPTP